MIVRVTRTTSVEWWWSASLVTADWTVNSQLWLVIIIIIECCKAYNEIRSRRMMTTTTDESLEMANCRKTWPVSSGAYTRLHTKLNGYSNQNENKKMSITCIARVLLVINWPSDSSCALMDAISELVSMHWRWRWWRVIGLIHCFMANS